MAHNPNVNNPGKIDVHHHIFAPAHLFPKAALNAKAGFRTPAENLPWSPRKSLEAMDGLGIEAAVLSYPAGMPFVLEGAGTGADEGWGASRRAARELNEYARGICEEGEGRGRFGWMACLPDWRDTEGALSELAHALDVLGADGVSLASSYGAGQDAVYVGDDMFDPIWEELDRREATVFLHGAQVPSSTPPPHPFLGIPVTEVPNETFKAAAHLVVTGKKRGYARVRIVLAHLGGTAAFLAPRAAALAGLMGCARAPQACLDDFASFYFDTALAAHAGTLVVPMLSPARLVFGTDFPAVSTDVAAWFGRNLDEYYAEDAQALAAVSRENALRLFPRLRDRIGRGTRHGAQFETAWGAASPRVA